MHEGKGSWVAELSDLDVDHTWLWRLNPLHGPTLCCEGSTEPVACAACQSRLPDSGASRATCCAVGEATCGHNMVTELTHAAAGSCYHAAEMAVPGLIPGADLTSALGNA